MTYRGNASRLFLFCSGLVLLMFVLLVPTAMPLLDAQNPSHTITDESNDQLQRRAQKLNSKERQQEIRRDADKIVELAGELKESVDKSSENVLSLDVVKKAEQIERLARTVKDKMKEAQ